MSIPNYEYRSDFAKRYYKQGKDEGRNEGRNEGRTEGRNEALLQLFERRLCRSLTTKEREKLAARLNVEGSIAMGDVVLDSSSEQLEVWLANLAP